MTDVTLLYEAIAYEREMEWNRVALVAAARGFLGEPGAGRTQGARWRRPAFPAPWKYALRVRRRRAT